MFFSMHILFQGENTSQPTSLYTIRYVSIVTILPVGLQNSSIDSKASTPVGHQSDQQVGGQKLWPSPPHPSVDKQFKPGTKLVLAEEPEPGRATLAAHCCSKSPPFYI